MKVSILIVNYNVKYFLEQCLDSVIRASRNIESEILVVDNQSSDHSIEYLAPRFPQVIFIANQENVGFSKANNQAIQDAGGEYILLLNPDTVIGENTLERVCRFMDEHPDAGGIGVKMLDGFGHFLPESKRGFPSPWNSFCKMSGLSKLFPGSTVWGKYHLRYLPEDSINEVDVLAGAFMLLRRKVLDEIGLLDETFFMYGEDIDLSYRIKQGGYKNYYIPEPIIHYKGESTKKDFKYVKNFYNAMLIFYDKYYPDTCFIHKWLIHFAVNTKTVLSAIDKLIKQKTPKKHPKVKERIFNTQKLPYQEIIAEMNKNTGKNVLYKIFNPVTGITIASNEVLFTNNV
jgi:GT2 family glycosyltransferase